MATSSTLSSSPDHSKSAVRAGPRPPRRLAGGAGRRGARAIRGERRRQVDLDRGRQRRRQEPDAGPCSARKRGLARGPRHGRPLGCRWSSRSRRWWSRCGSSRTSISGVAGTPGGGPGVVLPGAAPGRLRGAARRRFARRLPPRRDQRGRGGGRPQVSATPAGRDREGFRVSADPNQPRRDDPARRADQRAERARGRDPVLAGRPWRDRVSFIYVSHILQRRPAHQHEPRRAPRRPDDRDLENDGVIGRSCTRLWSVASGARTTTARLNRQGSQDDKPVRRAAVRHVCGASSPT